ncbi:MAG: hypothetical protein IPI77_19455 [Saprospiraceae bacterium]|nr:hypothetical protein [Saprospiraceae bacterium]
MPDVDAIPDHIQEGLNGFLINSKNSEDAIIEEAIIKLKRLIADHKKLPLISSSAFDYVCSKFTKELFVQIVQANHSKRISG